MDAEIVKLDMIEFTQAVNAGVWRHIISLDRAGSDGLQDDGWKTDIEGAVGEYVAHRYLGLHWVPAHSQYPEVIAPKRSVIVKTTSRMGNALLVPKSGRHDAIYVLVMGDFTPRVSEKTNRRYFKFYLPGWMSGEEAMQEQYWDPGLPEGVLRRPAFRVMPDQLHPISTFPGRPVSSS